MARLPTMHMSLNEPSLALFGLGFALGVRHALDPDHLVAVSTIVSRNKSIARSSVAGAFWGAGHTASLFICGSIVLALRLQIPDSFVATAERAVAMMLVLLGVNALWRAFTSSRLQLQAHTHVLKTGFKSFVVGM